jgi:7-cyano-7-deazaguanine reductase
VASINSLQEKYEDLGKRFQSSRNGVIDSSLLMAFDYEYQGQDAEVAIATREFTAVCPWTNLPDFGTLTVTYVPKQYCIELKSFKYYLSSFTGVGIVQEHAANRILTDLFQCCQPGWMEITLDYNTRGGLHTTVKVRREDT